MHIVDSTNKFNDNKIIGSEHSVVIDPVRYTVHQIGLLPRNRKTFAFEEILIKTAVSATTEGTSW
jgi:hypothetical protein